MALTLSARAARFACIVALTCGLGAPAAGQETAILYRHSQVWTGEGFETRDLAVQGGQFVDPRSVRRNARTISLRGQYVVPAYANAHVHITQATPDANALFLTNGVFYAYNPNTVVLGAEYRAFFSRQDTYDAAIAQGGITEPGGHPESIYVRFLGPRVYPGRTLEDFIGDAFHYGRTHEEIDAALDLLVSQGADFVKAYLLFSEEYEARRADERFYGYRGINPANARYLVEAAQRRNLRVAFHVETPADLVVAARSGAAIAAHLPGYTVMASRYTSATGLRASPEGVIARALTPAEARLVAQSGMMLTPTYRLLADRYEGDLTPDDARIFAAQRGVQSANLRLLAQNGATFLIGTDGIVSIFDEVEYLDGLGALPRERLLRATLETGARLFPNRRIGCFEAGCEADFLVLRENPLADVRALRSISLRIKAGNEVGASTAP